MIGDEALQAEPPSRRIVLLGASNLLFGMSTIVDLTGKMWNQPREIVGAMGLGRSYGLESWVLCRSLPGILSCGIWEALSDRRAVPTAALITDVGNDILYDVPVDRIVQWIERCLERLAPISERIIVTELPLASISTLGRRQFSVLRSVLFPRCRLSLDEAIARARQLNDALARLATRYDATRVVPHRDWYWFDPIHIRMRCFGDAWSKILAPWTDGRFAQPASASLRRAVYLRCLRPHRRRWFAMEQRRRQPVGRLIDGSTIALY